MRYKVIRVIGVVLLGLGATAIILQFMEGGKSVVGSIAAGAVPVMFGCILLGRSFRLEKKMKASGDPSSPLK